VHRVHQAQLLGDVAVDPGAAGAGAVVLQAVRREVPGLRGVLAEVFPDPNI
jgi:hypothetical protein